MGFFEDKRDHVVEALAIQLRDGLKKAGKLLKPYNPKSWYTDFRILTKDYGVEQARKVLVWYLQHITEQFVPVAFSAHSFRLKFRQIVQAMERSDDPSEDAVDQRSRELARRLTNDHAFPVEIIAVLPTIAHESRKRWDHFCKELDIWSTAGGGPLAHSRRTQFMRRVLATSPFFVESWLIFLSQKFGHLTAYTGSTSGLIFKPDSKWFRESFWHRWSQEWTGDARTFDGLLNDLIGGKHGPADKETPQPDRQAGDKAQ